MLIKKSLRLSSILILFLATSTGLVFAQTLREQADKRGLLVGAAVEPALFAEAPYASTLAREFNMVEPENVMKWGTVRPAQDKFNFGPGDKVVADRKSTRLNSSHQIISYAVFFNFYSLSLDDALPILREQADKRGLLVGAAVEPALFAEAPYASTLAREFNMVEPENVMKWGTVRPAQDKFNFGPGDKVV